VTSAAQIEAFEDTWHWNEQAEREFDELLYQANTSVADMMRALRNFLGEKLMDGWRSVSPKTSHVIAIRKIERQEWSHAVQGNAAMGFCLPDRIGCSFLVVLKPKPLAADTIIGIRLIIWACMEKVNPDLVVRDKRGRSYAERKLSERPWDTRPLACLAYKLKVAVQRTATFKL
jgi:hypothetical protein